MTDKVKKPSIGNTKGVSRKKQNLKTQLSEIDSPDCAKEEFCGRLVHTIRSAIKNALTELGKADQDVTNAVHECRKKLKIARALLDLVAPGGTAKSGDRVVRHLRDAGRCLAETRGAAAMIESFSMLASRNPDDDMREAYGRAQELFSDRYQKGCSTDSGMLLPVQKAAGRIKKVLRSRGGSLNRTPTRCHVVERGVNAYRRARNGMRMARKHRTPETIHEWRKKAKTLRYQQEFFLGAGITIPEHFPDQLHRLTDYLGTAHDAALLIEFLRADKELPLSNIERARIGIAGTQYYRECSKNAFDLGEEIFRESEERYQEYLVEEKESQNLDNISETPRS